MKVALVAQDIAPSQAFAKVTEELGKRGYSTFSLLGRGRRIEEFLGDVTLEDFKDWINLADSVLVGMSSSRELAEFELTACSIAKEAEIPYGFYADTFGCHRRSWFDAFREHAKYLFVINPTEAEDARGLYPRARIVASGNPMWEDFAFPKLSRHESRKLVDVGPEDILILSPGGKILAINVLLWGAIIEAVHVRGSFFRERKTTIICSLHPGDRNPPDLYKELAEFSYVPVKIVQDIKTSDLIPACDLLVESASTSGIEAAYQRIPVIDYFTKVALHRLEKTSGRSVWEPCELGVAERVLASESEGYADKFCTVMEAFLDGESLLARFQKLQHERIFPLPTTRGKAVEEIVSTLELFIK